MAKEIILNISYYWPILTMAYIVYSMIRISKLIDDIEYNEHFKNWDNVQIEDVWVVTDRGLIKFLDYERLLKLNKE